ncbi:HYR domain-containing protein [Salinimicrobium soli]|uniref:HYR domain-containing protein n=1 Tax=Salinimicrobium soli TaxID=1254399 RepID=UPI003AAD2A32
MKGPLVFGQEPIYTHNPGESKNLDYFTITSADAFNPQAKINRLVIAVDVAPNGEVFVLTFGDGIKKVGANGGLVNFIPNQSDRLSNALDFAINSDGKFFVATNESNRRFIRVYSPTGAYLSGETLGDGTYGTGPNQFKGPSGLTFDKDDNLFVADQYLGDADPPRPSAIKIYRKDAAGSYKNNLIQEFDNVQGTILNFPYRIAVNSQGQLYMSELGQTGDASVKIIEFDANFNPLSMSPGPSAQLGAPGSIVIDKFDNVFVADFGNEIDLPRILNATEDLDEFYAVFEIIINGIDNNVFKINVYNPDSTFNSIISSQIDFPIDLAISPCGTLYVNNAIFDGRVRSIFGFTVPDFTLDFDLEAYDRSAGYDTEDPVVLNCSNDLNVELTNGRFTVDDYRNLQSFSDNCDDDLEIIQSPPAGTSISQTTTVSITAKDDSGNESAACTFQLIITEEQQPPSFTCSAPGDLTLNIGADCSVNASDYSEYITNPENFQNGIRIEQEESVLGNIMTVTLTVFDGEEEVDTCTFEVTLLDVTAPEITSCDATSIEIELAAGESFTIQDYSSRISASDCDSNFTINQSPAEGAQITETTRVTLTATDGSGNESAACSFQVIITEEQQPPSFTCNAPVDLTLNIGADCSVNASDYSGYITNPENFQNGIRIEQEESVSGSIMTVTLTVFDGEEEVDTCTFEVTLLDVTAPEITSCDATSIEIELAAGESFTIQDYSSRISASDCDSNFTINQSPAEGAQITETTRVTLTATDGSGNESAACSFQVIITEEQQPPSFTCNAPVDLTLNIGADCSVNASDYSGYITNPENFQNGIRIEQEESVSGSIMTVTLTVFDGEEEVDTCTFEVTLLDVTAPEITSCDTTSIEIELAAGESFTIQDYSSRISASDCDSNFTINQSPAEGAQITETTTVTLTAIDGSGNGSNACSFEIIIIEEQQALQITNCPPSRTESLGNDCSFILPDYTNEAAANVEATFSQTPVAGTVITAATEVIIKAEANGETKECSFEVSLQDNIIPEISCPSDKTVNFDPAIGFTVLDYRGEAIASDNCSFEIVQDPPPGTVLFQSRWIFLTAIDASDNQIVCEFALNLTEGATPEISCKDVTIELDATGKANLDASSIFDGDFYDPSIRSFSLDKGSFDCSDIGVEVPVELTVEYMNGTTAQCTSKVTVVDNSDPVVNCVSTFTLYLNEEGYGILSPGILDRNSTDNCGIAEMKLNKTRFDNSDVGDQTIVLTVTDTSGNTETCETLLTVVPYGERTVTCAEEIDLPLDENGEATLKLTYTGNEENIEVVTSKTNFTCDDLGSEVVTATYIGEYSGSCEIQINILDNLPPQIDCVSSYTLRLNEQGTGTISEELLNLNYSDNCGVSRAIFSKTNFTTQDIGNNNITFTVNDSSGNESSCTINVMVIPFDYAGPDFECKDSFTLELNSNGQAFLSSSDVYTGEALGVVFELSKSMFTCSDIGSEEIEVSYSGSATGTCTLEVVVEDNLAPAISCVATLEVYLDQTGSATISPQDIDYGSTDNCSITSRTLSITTFSEADLGENTVTLTVIDASENISTCEATVIVKPQQGPAPVVCVESVVLELNSNGRVTLDPQQLFSGGPADLEYSVNRTQFTCLDLGEQNVVFTYSSESDSGSCEIPLLVIDPNNYCEEFIGGNGPFVILYPNPGNGEVSIKVSPGIILKRAEVFDAKGRFLLEKSFEENSAEDLYYRLNLTAFQSGVYTLMLYSQDKEYIRRAIIRND